jgi:hypothetical protein
MEEKVSTIRQEVVTPIVTDFVTEKIMVLAGQGKPTREIAEILTEDGIEISHMTVARRLQGVLNMT